LREQSSKGGEACTDFGHKTLIRANAAMSEVQVGAKPSASFVNAQSLLYLFIVSDRDG
jgi:hypothetical protein